MVKLFDEFKVYSHIIAAFLFQINEDLFGEVKFLAQTGPLSVPIKCTTKKCDVSSNAYKPTRKLYCDIKCK